MMVNHDDDRNRQFLLYTALDGAVLETLDDKILERTNERADQFQITTGVKTGVENEKKCSLP